MLFRGDYFLFGLIFIKKIIKPKFFLKKKNRNRFKPIGFGFLGQKPVQTGLTLFFRFGSVFFGLGSVRFDFFGFRLIKPNQLIFSKF